MTLAEAIAHEDWAASTAHGELADEHAQMRDWLRELERLRSCSCTDDERTDLAAENERLREQSEQLFDKTLELATENSKLRELCKLCEREAENARLRELLLDVADVLGENEKLLGLANRLRSAVLDGADNARDVLAENAKLRKLLLDVWNDAMQFDGFWDYVNDDGEIYNEDELPHYQERMRELGIEVD